MSVPPANPRINLLGPIRTLTEHGPNYLGPARQRELLAILVLRRGAPAGVDQLAADLWGEDRPRSAANLVHTYVGRLRGLLESALSGPVIRSRCPGYQLDLDLADTAVTVDLDLFEEKLTRARYAMTVGDLPRAESLLGRALALWSGPRPLDPATGPAVLAERSRLLELRVDAFEDLMATRVTLGWLTWTVAELTAMVSTHPLRERLWALLLMALAQAGRRGEALAAFGRARQVLASELGVDPGAELLGLQRALLRGEPLPAPVPHGSWPVPPRVAEPGSDPTRTLHRASQLTGG